MVQTEHWSFFLAKKSLGDPQVVLILGLSTGDADSRKGTFCPFCVPIHKKKKKKPCLFYAGACGLFLCGLLGEIFCSVFLSSACGFLFTAFSRQLAAIGVLFVVSSTGCCLNGWVLCSSSSQLSFSFPANVCWGPGGVLLFGPCEFSFVFCGSFAPC